MNDIGKGSRPAAVEGETSATGAAAGRSRLGPALVPIDREGWPFIAAFSGAALVLYYASEPLGLVGAALAVWCVCFFRDPERTPPTGANLVVSPADGVIQVVDMAPPPPELDMGAAPRHRVAIFMNALNVHVNRVPWAGVVGAIAYRPGRFFNASLDKASRHNERLSLRVALGGGGDMAVVQIAGLIARRIVCRVAEGETVRTGQRFGMIRFGSRVEVFLPAGVVPAVRAGERATAGETVIAVVGAAPGGSVGPQGRE